ncbi:hypothetical protein [Nocardia brasiliensis]|uniref:hypothetical protein n=1 Tax=Nocardia brasiliensis TaxID=37326 RepID=UPI0024540B14|nr:hypothetical protein [Nocardia brasiliensis]
MTSDTSNSKRPPEISPEMAAIGEWVYQDAITWVMNTYGKCHRHIATSYATWLALLVIELYADPSDIHHPRDFALWAEIHQKAQDGTSRRT